MEKLMSLLTSWFPYETINIAMILGLLASIVLVFKKYLKSKTCPLCHYSGVAINWRIPVILFGVAVFLYGLIKQEWIKTEYDLVLLAFIVSMFGIAIYIAIRLKHFAKFDTNSKKDAFNHKILMAILFCIGGVILSVIFIFGIRQEKIGPFGVFSALLAWIFQDAILGVTAYYNLRSNDLLHIGDWIEIPQNNINGVISDISLVTVTVKNWDNTTSNIPISSLQKGSFKNNQEMLEGNTTGRRMYRSFIIDSRSIKEIDENTMEELQKKTESQKDFNTFLKNSSTENLLNIYLYREYLMCWLRKNTNVSRNPRLIVRLMEPTAEGVPIQIYVFIMKTKLPRFEQEQSRITEHVLLSMGWFGLRLYQRPSGSDICNNMYNS